MDQVIIELLFLLLFIWLFTRAKNDYENGEEFGMFWMGFDVAMIVSCAISLLKAVVTL